MPKRCLTPDAPTTVVSDKRRGEFSWRDATVSIQQMQALKRQASWSQDEAKISVNADVPIGVITLSDTHIGSWAADYEAFRRITDEILAIPTLYIALLGDVVEMAINMRSVLEVTNSVLDPEQQHLFVESWLEEMAPRILFSTWDNHTVMREEKGAGHSHYAYMMKRRVIWHSGIGHPDVQVGAETYKLCASHRFRGRSIYNPCHGAQQYLQREAPTRDIAMAGDSHVPGLLKFVHGGEVKLAVNSGSLHSDSGYAKRHFSLHSYPIFPVIQLHPHHHQFDAFWSVEEWQRAARRGVRG